MHQDCEVSIITVNYNGFADTCALIDTIPAFDRSLEVIVVDNGSAEDEASLISARYPMITAIRSDKNLGFAGGNNLGIKASHGRYLFLINNDTIFKQFDIRQLINRLESSDRIGVVCPKILFAWGNHPIQFAGYTPLSPVTVRNRAIGFGEPDCGQYETARPTPYAHGAAMMIRREVIERAGMMPECFFLYYEEIDWSVRISQAGYEIWYEPASTIYHKESQSTGQDSPLRTYYITRNRLLLVKRNTTGIARYLSYAYLMLAVAPKDIAVSAYHKRLDLSKATVKGIINFLKS